MGAYLRGYSAVMDAVAFLHADPSARPGAAHAGRDPLRPGRDDFAAALRQAFDGVPRLVALPGAAWHATDVHEIPVGATFVDLTVVLDLPWAQTRRYEHSKLYWAAEEPFEFSEERVICFNVRWLRRVQTVRIRLPQRATGTGRLCLRLDPFPYCDAGTMALHSIRVVAGDARAEASRVANAHALKQWVRAQVERAEDERHVRCAHLPSSLSVELTPRCNLTCSHCSSHGDPELHRRHNRLSEITEDVLGRLGRDAFPSLTAFGLVGRGEPLAVTTPRWRQLVALLKRHHVLLTAVTNGTLLHRRITADVVPLIETLTVSVDGATPQTFAKHRGGTAITRVLEQVHAFDALRRAQGLTRRPRLGFSWTLMRDNVAEFPRFLEEALPLEPDLVYARHLLVFYERVREQSLLGHPALANPHLRRAYALMAEHDVRSDCPPLLADAPRETTPAAPTARDGCMFVRRTGVIHANGDVPTCSAPFAAIAGTLADASFPEVWNGEILRDVRARLDTDNEWEQCANCWYREGRYEAQRAAADLRGDRVELATPGSFTEEAWDFRQNDLSAVR